MKKKILTMFTEKPAALLLGSSILALFIGLGLMTFMTRSATASGQMSTNLPTNSTMNSQMDVREVEVSGWQESAEQARTYLQNFQIDNRPLVRIAAGYDVDQRVIHDERSRGTSFPVQLTEEEWRSKLTPEQFHIIRQSGTERAFTSELDRVYERGIYYSRATGQPLFSSEDKYDSRTGWPSFTKPITPEAIAYFYETSFFSRNIEVVDSLSGAHLGHVFPDGPGPTYQRYCINGEALIFVPEGGNPPELLVPESKIN